MRYQSGPRFLGNRFARILVVAGFSPRSYAFEAGTRLKPAATYTIHGLSKREGKRIAQKCRGQRYRRVTFYLLLLYDCRPGRKQTVSDSEPPLHYVDSSI